MNSTKVQGSDIRGHSTRRLVRLDVRAGRATLPPRDLSPLSAFTMVELMLAAVILLAAILGLIFSLGVNVQGLSASRQSHIALNAARSKIEVMKGRPFGRLLDEYGSGSSGESFPVTWQTGGRTLSLTNPGGGDAATIIFELNETDIDDAFGWVTQYDLNGDGDASDWDVSADYKILPVSVRVEWEDAGGPRMVETRTILFDPKYP